MNSAQCNSVTQSQILPLNFHRINSANVYWTPIRFHGYKDKPQSLSPRKFLFRRIIGTDAALVSLFIYLIIDVAFIHSSKHHARFSAAYINSAGLMVQNSINRRQKHKIIAVAQACSTNLSPTLCWIFRIQCQTKHTRRKLLMFSWRRKNEQEYYRSS